MILSLKPKKFRTWAAIERASSGRMPSWPTDRRIAFASESKSTGPGVYDNTVSVGIPARVVVMSCSVRSGTGLRRVYRLGLGSFEAPLAVPRMGGIYPSGRYM